MSENSSNFNSPHKQRILKRRKSVSDRYFSERNVGRYFCESTPLHGFQSIALTESVWKKLLWSCCIAFSFLCALYQISTVILDYQEQKTTYGLSLIEADFLKFPDVLLCDVDPSNYTMEQTLNKKVPGGGQLLPLVKHFSFQWNFSNVVLRTGKKPISPLMLKSIAAVEEAERERNVSFKELVLSLGHQCGQFFKYCHRGDKSRKFFQPQMLDCCEEALPMVYSGFGLCYIIPGRNQSRHDNLLGNFGALLSVSVQTNKQWNRPQSVALNGIFIGLAYHFLSEFDSQFLTAIPGTFTLIHLSPKRTVQLNRVLQPCTAGSTESIWACQRHCELWYFRRFCGCVPVASVHMALKNDSICEIRDILDCIDENRNEFVKVQTCIKGCRRPCEQWTYQTTVSNIPSVQMNQSNVDEGTDWKNLAQINIFFNSLEYTEVIQFYTMTLASLLGAIGGLFGIYVGGSLLAILHCVFTGFEVTKWMLSARLEESSMTQNNNILSGIPDDLGDGGIKSRLRWRYRRKPTNLNLLHEQQPLRSKEIFDENYLPSVPKVRFQDF